MVSTKKGLKAMVKLQMNPYILFTHCICHKLALGMSNLVKGKKKID